MTVRGQGEKVVIKLADISYESIIENLHDGLYFVDRNRVITYWNKAAEQISGFAADEVVGRSCSDNILTHVDGSGRSLCFGMCPLAQSIADGKFREAEVYLHHKDGHRIPVSVRVSVLRDKEGRIIGGIELFTDISNRKVNALRLQELENLALLDNLTQLANRNYIERELLSRFAEKKRFQLPFGVLFMDIDRFKQVNDRYGHDAGDEVLRFVAKTFLAGSRPFDLYGRWGGEEFLAIIHNISPQDLEQLGNRLRLLVGQSYITYDRARLQVTISLGATLVQDDDTMESLLKRADTLMYRSKAAGRNCLTIG
jgi:diguanylate cyclase (GGDEF)-like protein/PAS domain S-box-containing protein